MLVNDSPLLPTSRPFWHRPEPLTSVIQLDPGHGNLQRIFPESWRYLLKVKALLDCTAHLDVPGALDRTEFDTWTRQLLAETARALEAFAVAERATGNSEIATQGDDLAATVDAYARMGAWPDYTVYTPRAGMPWIYCGPLATWAERDTRMPLTLLVTEPDPVAQRAVDRMTASIPTIGQAVGDALGRPAVPVNGTPGMYATQLVLAGGESALGHKNFAHFMPLETPHGSVDVPFTVIFANVHRERLIRCSLPLLRAELGVDTVWDPDAVLAASLAWFRCHDLGHFWRAINHTGRGSLTNVMRGFDLMALEESYADSLGVLCAAELWDAEYLAVAFYAELIRYLSRNASSFADSVAATLELGWLTQHGVLLEPPFAELAKRTAGCLTELVPLLHDALWTPGPPDMDSVQGALDVGQQEARHFSPLYHKMATDVNYTFG